MGRNPNRTPLLEAISLTKRDPGETLRLDAVTLSIHPGEIYCVLGAAGAGKTLLLQSFLGLTVPTAGRVFVAGIDVGRDPIGARRQITYVARGAALYPTMTACANLQFFTTVDGRAAPQPKQHYYNVMRRVGLPERFFERPAWRLGRAYSLSLWLAIALMKDTPVILMDEPTAGLDLHASAALQQSLKDLRGAGKAMLIGSADVLLAARIADRIGILNDGRKAVELSREELVGRSLPSVYGEYAGRPIELSTEQW